MDESAVDPSEPRKSISSERTFFRDLERDEDLEGRLLELATSVGSTLRSKELRARTVTVKLRDHDFRTRQHSRTLPQGIESSAAIYEVSRMLLADLRAARRVPVRLLGVALSGLGGAEREPQLTLFGEPEAAEREKDRSVSRAVDELESRFGRGTVRPGRMIDPARPRRPSAPDGRGSGP